MFRLALLASLLPAFAQDEATADAAPDATEAPAAPAGPVTYRIDPAQSHLTVVIYNDFDRWTPVKGHDHAIEPTTFTGTVVWSETDAGACAVDIALNAVDLRIDPPGARVRAGIDPDGSIPEGTKSTVIGNMLGRSQLDADDHPTVSYRAASCSGTEGTVQVKGSMTAHGVSKTFSLPMQVSVGDGRFAAKGKVDLTHTDFGMKPFTYGPATPKNLDRLTFVIDVVGTATP